MDRKCWLYTYMVHTVENYVLLAAKISSAQMNFGRGDRKSMGCIFRRLKRQKLRSIFSLTLYCFPDDRLGFSSLIKISSENCRDRKKFISLKGQCHEIFASDFVMNHLPPKPLKITLGSFQIFSKTPGDICKSMCTISIYDTDGKFATVSMAPAAKLTPISTTPVANLPPVLMTPIANNGNNIRLLTT